MKWRGCIGVNGWSIFFIYWSLITQPNIRNFWLHFICFAAEMHTVATFNIPLEGIQDKLAS